MRRYDFVSVSADPGRREVLITPRGQWVLHADHERAVATLTRERDEARAALALAHTRALQTAADVVLNAETRLFDGANECEVLEFLDDLANEITDLTPDDIDLIAEEHDHG